jgi:hypothetical protein
VPYSAGITTQSNKTPATAKAIIVDLNSCEDEGKSFSDGLCVLNILSPIMN